MGAFDVMRKIAIYERKCPEMAFMLLQQLVGFKQSFENLSVQRILIWSV